MKSLVKIFAALILVFSLSGVASAKNGKELTAVKPEMTLSLACENNQIAFTIMSMEDGIVEKTIKSAVAQAQNHEVSISLISVQDGIILHKAGKDELHESIDFKDLPSGEYKVLVEYRGSIVARDFVIK